MAQKILEEYDYSEYGEPVNNRRGSVWHRWDPHIHAPGTLLNDQFAGGNPWEDFLSIIEASDPPIRALGVTDYFGIDVYEEVCQWKAQGRLPQVDLIFPNIELRFSIGTTKGSPINAHLLISPEEDDHIYRIRHFLRRLTFEIANETYHCENSDLIRLGRVCDSTIQEDRKALEAGANQFKVNFDQLKEEIRGNDWAKRNILVAISGNSGDGTPGLQKDTSFSALRTELERCAHIIFASNEKQRDFWLGLGAASEEELIQKWGGCKPCLHGSDAHHHDHVGKPALNRFTWVKGDIKFESLRQTCIEPEGRVFIGESPPIHGLPSYTIENLTVNNADWLEVSDLSLNPGLVTIIGARGSGKTALVDLIAVGGYSTDPTSNDKSFINRARDLLNNETVTLNWESGEKTETEIQSFNYYYEAEEFSKVQYLSQHFVNQLCSSEGLAKELMAEIERVIFEAHPIEERFDTTTFSEFLEFCSSSVVSQREENEGALKGITEEITKERHLKDCLASLKKNLEEKEGALAKDKKERQTLLKKGQEERIQNLQNVTSALDLVREKLQKVTRKEKALRELQEEVDRYRDSVFPATLKKLKVAHAAAELVATQWDSFNLRFKGDVDVILSSELTKVRKQISFIKGPFINVPEDRDLNLSFVEQGKELGAQSYNVLVQESARLESLIGIDKENKRKFQQLGEKITKELAAKAQIQNKIQKAETAHQRIAELISQRDAAYREVFKSILMQEKILTNLYRPLMKNLEAEGGTLGKLTFHVKRTADVERWAEEGEELLDLRKAGAFKGKGSLLEKAKSELQAPWETGTAEEIMQAMAAFREQHESNLLSHFPSEITDPGDYLTWANQMGEWLYGTTHIAIKYGVQYDGVDIQQLSPGTRGIVLLLLYLAIDKEDVRPLIIDQPEENLDPKSIFDELVPRFKDAKLRRQIIVVTHNANLVVNTDADQVIVATCGSHRPNQLPLIKYYSGGLENPEIRRHVCEILEGGEKAFKERARRLRVTI